MTIPAETMTVELATGTLTLARESGPPIADLCDFAARANPKRGYLIVSKVLGRHVPTRPSAMRATMDQLGALLPADLPAPVLFLGMAETATALGQGVFAAFRKLHPETAAVYVQSSRQRVANSAIIASFEEGHSHATTHLVQVAGDDILTLVRQARSLVIVDDECSTGNTFLAGIDSLAAALPNLEQVQTCCITDWSDRTYCQEAALPTRAHALLVGRMNWTSKPSQIAPELSAGTNGAGRAPAIGMRSRTGLLESEQAVRSAPQFSAGERVLVLGEGEHSYEALLVAEAIEAAGGIAAVQCITRSPALLGHAMTSVSHFSDSYESSAPCFLYNIIGHAPDLVAVVTEVESRQLEEVEKALIQVGGTSRVQCLSCTYVDEAA